MNDYNYYTYELFLPDNIPYSDVTNTTIYVGKTVQLKVKGTKKKPKWGSSNKKVAIVNKKGKVKGKKAGKGAAFQKQVLGWFQREYDRRVFARKELPALSGWESE